MELVWNPWAVLPLLAAVLGLGMAAVVFLAGPARLQNRTLALLLLVNSITQGFNGLHRMATDPATAFAADIVWTATWIAGLPLTLLFLSTIASPLSRPLRPVAVRFGLLLASVASLAAIVVFATTLKPRMLDGASFYLLWETAEGPLTFYMLYVSLGVGLWGLAVAVSAYLAAPSGSAARARARAYAVAFGVTDVLGLVFTGAVTYLSLGQWEEWSRIMVAGAGPLTLQDEAIRLVVAGGWAFTAILFDALLLYAILRTRLFDIDLKIKWTVRQSTVAAAFIAVFFVVSELASNLLSERVGPVAGVLAAGALVFAIAPLQRAAERVADRAMPGVATTPEYLASRKFLVYRGAVEAALEDGAVTDRERGVLVRLQRDLGLTSADAAAIEAEVRATAPVAAMG